MSNPLSVAAMNIPAAETVRKRPKRHHSPDFESFNIMVQSSASLKRQRRKRPHHGPNSPTTSTSPSSSSSILNPETKHMHRRLVSLQHILFVFVALLIASPLGGVWAAPSEIEKAVRGQESFLFGWLCWASQCLNISRAAWMMAFFLFFSFMVLLLYSVKK